MMLKLKMLAVTLLLSLTAFSQTDTGSDQKDTIIHLPIQTARSIVHDLLKYDECTDLLKNANAQLKIYQEKDSTQSIMLQERALQYNDCRSQVEAQKQQIQIYATNVDELSRSNKRLKTATITLGSTTGVAIITTVLLFILK